MPGREGSCEDNENSGKKSCSHLARSTLPGRRGSLLHKVLYEEVSPRGPTPAYVAIVSCSSEAKNEEQESKIARKMALVSSLARPKPRIPLPALLLAPFFARSLTLVPSSLLLNHTETLATQARRISKLENQFLCVQKPTSFRY